MISIDIETILTIVYVLVDDWYEASGKELLKGKVGCRPTFKDSEGLTLMLCADYMPYPGEQQFLGYIRANYGALFPKLPDQSQFNRRCRSLRHLLEALRRSWLHELGVFWICSGSILMEQLSCLIQMDTICYTGMHPKRSDVI